MIRPINRNILSLGVKSTPATKADLSIGDDLMDTLMANIEGCVGMAANMIGVPQRTVPRTDVQSRNHCQVGEVRNRGGLPVSGGCAPLHTV